jgi:hypothetical protein
MFIPGLLNTVQIVEDDLPDAVQFLCREAVVVRQDNGFEPEFADGPVPAHMDVPRFVTIEAVEEEPIRARNTGDRRQGGYLQLLAEKIRSQSWSAQNKASGTVSSILHKTAALPSTNCYEEIMKRFLTPLFSRNRLGRGMRIKRPQRLCIARTFILPRFSAFPVPSLRVSVAVFAPRRAVY